jgi:ATP-dependent Clp protease ATP-binding subunit ClpA
LASFDESKYKSLGASLLGRLNARPLKRAIQRYLEDELADIVLGGELEVGDTILMDLNKETSEIKARIVKPSTPLEDNQPKELAE